MLDMKFLSAECQDSCNLVCMITQGYILFSVSTELVSKCTRQIFNKTKQIHLKGGSSQILIFKSMQLFLLFYFTFDLIPPKPPEGLEGKLRHFSSHFLTKSSKMLVLLSSWGWLQCMATFPVKDSDIKLEPYYPIIVSVFLYYYLLLIILCSSFKTILI